MTKGLEALENICNQCEHYQFEKGLKPKQCPFSKQCVFKTRIEKELKALDIIKKHLSEQVANVKGDKPQKCLLMLIMENEESYDLLKEVLKDE